MTSFRHYPYTRMLQLGNFTGETIFDVEVVFARWGFGSGRLRLADKLEPREILRKSLENFNVKFSSVYFNYRRADNTEVKSQELHSPFNAYHKWLALSLGDGGRILGIGRYQGVPAPAYYTSLFLPWERQEEEYGAIAEVEPEKTARIVDFMELVNISAKAIHVKELKIHVNEGEDIIVDFDRPFHPNAFFDIDYEDKRLSGVTISYSFQETDFVEHVAFSGGARVQFGSVYLVDHNGKEGYWLDSSSSSGVDQERARDELRPNVKIETDPDPDYPDAYCHNPMRLRNLEGFPVWVRYSASYKTEGPASLCTMTPSVEIREATLGPHEIKRLGCSRYKTPSMWCVEIRQWNILSSARRS